MSSTVAEIRTNFERALWVVDHAVIRSLPKIDEFGNPLPGAPVQPERLAHEVLAEAIRVSRRGVPRRGLTVRLWLALLIAAAFDGSATTAAMFDLATGQLPRDLQWELQILVCHGKRGQIRMLTVKQLYNMGELITKHLGPAAADLTETERARRVALIDSICMALKDATLVVPPTSTSYAVDESGVWAWRKAPPKPKDVAPIDPLDTLSAQQRKARKKKDVVEVEPTGDAVEESQRKYGPKDEDAVVKPKPAAFDRVRDKLREALASERGEGDMTTPAPGAPAPSDRPSGCSYAAWGQKTHKSGRVTGYYGYALHALIRVPDLQHDQRGPFTDALAGPLLVQDFALTPASTDIVNPTLGMVHRVIASGHQIIDLLGDRHYSYKKYSRWISKLWPLGVRPVMDLRATDHGAFDYNGATVLAGTPHCGVPVGLQKIPGPGVIASEEDKDLFAAAIDARAPYAMQRVQTPWQNRDGVTRWRCGARADQVGCPNLEGSTETAISNGLPIVDPPATKTAWCDFDTATIKAIPEMKYQQEHIWGSHKWRVSYSRRTYVEGCFGNLKNPRTGNLHRGFMQYEGQALVTLTIAAAVVAYNLRELETWYLRASKLNEGEYWETLRTGDKARGTQTKARLAAYAAHPLHQKTIHQFGFVMLTANQQAEMDAEHTPRTTQCWASKKTNRPLVAVTRRSA
jgi:hypothetical protein